MKQRKNKNEKGTKAENTHDQVSDQTEIKEDNTTDSKENGKDIKEANNETANDTPNDWQKKYEEMNDKYLRLYSEFDNFRKRALKERIELSKTASEEVLVEMLTILDDFERAIDSFETVQTVEPLKEGTLLIFNKFKNKLTQKGLIEIEAKGKTFDTDYHEAIANVPSTSEDQKNKILDVTQKGYLLNGKVIRFAKVVVNN